MGWAGKLLLSLLRQHRQWWESNPTKEVSGECENNHLQAEMEIRNSLVLAWKSYFPLAAKESSTMQHWDPQDPPYPHS